MAKLTKKEKYIADMYVRYFGRAADKDKIDAYAKEAKKTTVILNNIIAEANAEKTGLDTTEFVNNAFQNLFGRDAFPGEMNKYSKIFDNKGKLPINSIYKSAVKADKDVYKNKIQVAAKYAELGGKDDLDLSKISKGNTVDLNKVFTLTDLTNEIENLADNSGIPSSFDGKDFVLTIGVDTGKDFVGTSKNDLFVAVDALDPTGAPIKTLTLSDSIDGGKGIDTLKIVTDDSTTGITDADFSDNTIKGIEIVDIKSRAAEVKLNTTADEVKNNFKDVTDLNITTTDAAAAASKITATVNETTNVTATTTGAGDITVTGGKVVTATATTGAIKVTDGKDVTATATSGTIDVVGGKNIVAKNTTAAITIKEDDNLTTAATIEKVTIDGTTGTSAIGTAIEGANALKELTVKNATGAITVITAVETLKVNLNDNTAANVTLTATSLKTLNVDASGKASFATITSTAETLNITGKANLTLASVTGLTAVKTVDGSKAQGDLKFSNTGTMTSIKTGSGNDTVTVDVAVATGTTINLGAGSDKLVAGSAGVDTSTTTLIDGGDGIDTLDAALVTIGNAGVFKNFEILSLTDDTNLDLALLTKSTFTTIAIDATAAKNFRLANVSKSQSLAVNADNAGGSTELVFKDVAGTADAYTINFSKDTAGVDAGLVSVEGIETVTVNSAGTAAAGTNKIELKDADAKSLVITGDKALTVTFNTAFGATTADATNGLGVSKIDASDSTGGINIDLNNVFAAVNGLTIKGGAGKDIIDITNLGTTAVSGDKIIVNAGAGDDEITVNAKGGILTGGTGKDTFDVTLAAVVGTAVTVADGAIKTTITDIEKDDKIAFGSTSADATTLIKATIDTTKASLDSALAAAAAAAAAKDATDTTTGTKAWFQYLGNTYIVDDAGSVAGSIDAGDVIVKLNGLVDLSTANYTAATDTITIG